MVIVGIDASTKKTGIAVFVGGKYLEHILIDYHKETNADIRISKMILSICDYLNKFDIDKIIIEKSIWKSNVDTLQKLSMISGAVLCYALQHGIKFENPVPTQWRKVIGLEQSSRVKREILKLESVIAVEHEYGISVTDDEAEAILIARSGFELPHIVISKNTIEEEVWN